MVLEWWNSACLTAEMIMNTSVGLVEVPEYLQRRTHFASEQDRLTKFTCWTWPVIHVDTSSSKPWFGIQSCDALKPRVWTFPYSLQMTHLKSSVKSVADEENSNIWKPCPLDAAEFEWISFIALFFWGCAKFFMVSELWARVWLGLRQGVNTQSGTAGLLKCYTLRSERLHSSLCQECQM